MLPESASPHTDRLWEIFPWVVYKSTLLKYLMQMKCIVFQASGVKLTLDDTQGYKPIMCNRCFKFKYVSTIGRFKKTPEPTFLFLLFLHHVGCFCSSLSRCWLEHSSRRCHPSPVPVAGLCSRRRGFVIVKHRLPVTPVASVVLVWHAIRFWRSRRGEICGGAAAAVLSRPLWRVAKWGPLQLGVGDVHGWESNSISVEKHTVTELHMCVCVCIQM